jgi:ATP-dependent Clp protease ATP-binding subunit ClpC
MYERFTDECRRAMQLANEEADRLNAEYIGAQHILLGLAGAEAGGAARVLSGLGVAPDGLRAAIEAVDPPPQSPPVRQSSRTSFVARLLRLQTTPSAKRPQSFWAKKTVERALEEARHLNQNYVGTHHMLLALLRESDSVAMRALENLGLSPDEIRSELARLLALQPNVT